MGFCGCHGGDEEAEVLLVLLVLSNLVLEVEVKIKAEAEAEAEVVVSNKGAVEKALKGKAEAAAATEER